MSLCWEEFMLVSKCEKSLELSDLHISLFLRFSLLYSHAEMLGYIAYPNG